MKLLSIKNLSFLHCGPVNLEIKAGECIGISGGSGSGKSRLLRAVADLDEHKGEVMLDQVNQQEIRASSWRKKVALLSAETHWWFDTVGEHFHSLPENQLHSLGFSQDVRSWPVARLSSGEKQRLGLLRLLENHPQVLLLDEPTANLDQKNVAIFEKFVIEYLSAQSACAIWVSHDNEQLQRISQQQLELVDGELI